MVTLDAPGGERLRAELRDRGFTSGASTDGASTTTTAGSCSPGKACWSRLYVCTAGRSCGSASAPGTTAFIPSAGRREGDEDGRGGQPADEAPREDAVQDPTPHPSTFRRWSRWRNGTRALLTRSPSHESNAGSTVSEPSTAIATTRIVAIANEPNVPSPVRNIPAIAVITVRPEMATARPEVAAAASSAALSLLPAARSSRSRFK